MRLIWILLLAFMVAGCADPTRIHSTEVNGRPLDTDRGADEYWFVHITGREHQDPGSGMACSVVWSHTVDLDARTIQYNDAQQSQNQVGERPKTVFAAEVWDDSSCPIAFMVSDAGELTIETTALGDVDVRIEDDGSVTVGGQTIVPGQSVTLSGSARGATYDGSAEFTMDLTIHVVGAWPHSGLIPSDTP